MTSKFSGFRGASYITALLASFFYLISTDDLIGVIDVRGFKLKPFIFLLLACLFVLGFVAGRKFRSCSTLIIRNFLVPTLLFTTWELAASYYHAGYFIPSPYILVVFCSFLTLLMVQLIIVSRRISILRILIYTGNLLAYVGIAQFVFSLAGIRILTAADWWIKDLLPRVNGLSYEPSYYALGLFPLFISLLFLGEYSGSSKIRRLCRKPLFLSGLALGFSSSRLSIVFAIVCVCVCGLTHLFRRRPTAPYKFRAIGAWTLGLILALSILITLEKTILRLHPEAHSNTFANGTGLGGTNPQSVVERLGRFKSTLNVGTQSPLFGIGISNIPTEIWRLETKGEKPFVRNSNIPMNPVAELFAGWGLLGAGLFFAYVIGLINFRAMPQLTLRRREMVFATLTATLLTFALLNYNQNIFRFYLWVFFGLTLSTLNVTNRRPDRSGAIES